MDLNSSEAEGFRRLVRDIVNLTREQTVTERDTDLSLTKFACFSVPEVADTLRAPRYHVYAAVRVLCELSLLHHYADGTFCWVNKPSAASQKNGFEMWRDVAHLHQQVEQLNLHTDLCKETLIRFILAGDNAMLGFVTYNDVQQFLGEEQMGLVFHAPPGTVVSVPHPDDGLESSDNHNSGQEGVETGILGSEDSPLKRKSCGTSLNARPEQQDSLSGSSMARAPEGHSKRQKLKHQSGKMVNGGAADEAAGPKEDRIDLKTSHRNSERTFMGMLPRRYQLYLTSTDGPIDSHLIPARVQQVQGEESNQGEGQSNHVPLARPTRISLETIRPDQYEIYSLPHGQKLL